MKTPEFWVDLWSQSGPFDLIDNSDEARFLVETIQKDALSDPMANVSDQQELEMARSIAMNERIRADQLYDEMMRMRTKWHEARRYLRAANKGAERNAQVMQLQSHTIERLLTKTKTTL